MKTFEDAARGRFAGIPRRGLFAAEHDELRNAVHSWVNAELSPHADEWERERGFPYRDVFAGAGSLGLFGAKYGDSYGGTGPDLVADAVVTEELARCGSGGVAAALGAHKDLGPYYIYRFGSEQQRQRWLVPAVAGTQIGALAITEPGAGSDVAGIATRADRPAGGGWRLTGTKVFITNGPIADFAIVAARSRQPTEQEGRYGGISLFVVEAGTAGFSAHRMDTVGWRTSHTGELIFDDVRLPDDALLGPEGEGFHQIMLAFDWERLVMALGAVAGAEETLKLAVAYARERSAFGRRVATFQTWRHRFADMATEIEAARSLTYGALRKIVAGEAATREVSMAKWFATELAWRVADEALQVHGGYGYMMEYPVQRAWRDARLGPIGGGTSEVMKEIIGRSFGL
jgi:acyl-CoA dehydrogenase